MLSVAILFIYSAGRFLTAGGFNWAIGSNRDGLLDVRPWISRAVRAHQNLTENIGPFAILVLVAHIAGKADVITAIGAKTFFFARVAHAGVYILGITYVRSLLWFVALVGELMILTQLFN